MLQKRKFCAYSVQRTAMSFVWKISKKIHSVWSVVKGECHCAGLPGSARPDRKEKAPARKGWGQETGGKPQDQWQRGQHRRHQTQNKGQGKGQKAELFRRGKARPELRSQKVRACMVRPRPSKLLPSSQALGVASACPAEEGASRSASCASRL